MPARRSLPERFWPRVSKQDDGCWIWTGARHPFGYGVMNVAEPPLRCRYVRAHRFSWELVNGPIPVGLCVLHTCDVPACVNPAHLFLGTKKDNTADMTKKGRHKTRFQRNVPAPTRILSDLAVMTIRSMYRDSAYTLKGLGALFGVHFGTIHAIVRNKSYREVSNACWR